MSANTELTPQQLAQIAAILGTDTLPTPSDVPAGPLADSLPVPPALTLDQLQQISAHVQEAQYHLETVLSIVLGALEPPPQLAPEDTTPPSLQVSPLAEQAPPTDLAPDA